jgi:hypothetical protein
MKPTDLRIGNFVEILGKIETVVDVMCDSVNTLTCEGVTYDMVHPIPLTEDRLVKFGFEPEYNNMTRITTFNLPDTPFSYVQGKFVINTSTGDFCVCIDKVHQLQNLYFAFRGEDLQIKNGTK